MGDIFFLKKADLKVCIKSFEELCFSTSFLGVVAGISTDFALQTGLIVHGVFSKVLLLFMFYFLFLNKSDIQYLINNLMRRDLLIDFLNSKTYKVQFLFWT